MNPLIKEKLFLSLSKNAKLEGIESVPVMKLSSKNAKRVHKYRQSKKSKSRVEKLSEEISLHKKRNSELTNDIKSLKRTVDLFSSIIDKHDKRKHVASNIIKRKDILEKLKSELEALSSAASEAKADKDISARELKSISNYVEKLKLVVHKKESDIDASMLL